MSNGYEPTMKILPKVIKVPFLHLQSMVHRSVDYEEDSYLQGDTYNVGLDNFFATFQTFRTVRLSYLQRR